MNREKNKSLITALGIQILYKKVNQEDYICISDMARIRDSEYPSDVIGGWMRNKNTIEFLGVWEKLYNPKFNSLEFEGVYSESGKNGFVLTPKRWIEKTGAVGIISNMGRLAGTFAHKDIAFKFASWLSVEFELYIIKEFQRLKEEEQKTIEWSAKRELAKINYRIHTDAIKENLIVPTLTKTQVFFVYASEADLINVALFGQRAIEWQRQNPDFKGNMRDYASVEQLLVLANIESYNAILIGQNISQSERIVKLNKAARSQLETLLAAKIRSDKLLGIKPIKNDK